MLNRSSWDRKIRKETARRKRDRGCAAEARPSHSGGGPDDRRTDL
jgi:hypothetical protein